MPYLTFLVQSTMLPGSTNDGSLTLLFDGKLAVRVTGEPFTLENIAFFVDKLSLALPLVVVPETFIMAAPVENGSSVSVHHTFLELAFIKIEAVVGGASADTMWHKLLEHPQNATD